MSDDELGKALGITPWTPCNVPAIVVDVPEDVSEDFNYARENLYTAIETGAAAMANLAALSTSAQSPRHYEVLTNLIKTLADVNNQLLDLQTKKNDIAKSVDGGQLQGPTTVNNNLVITTAELSKMISDIGNSSNGN